MCSSFAFAVKHYLREEDGLNYDDYIGILPPTFAQDDDAEYNANNNSGVAAYGAIGENSKRNSRDGSRSGRTSPDATKRVRSKRKPTISVSGSASPLLGAAHTAVDFRQLPDHGSIPLPLV